MNTQKVNKQTIWDSYNWVFDEIIIKSKYNFIKSLTTIWKKRAEKDAKFLCGVDHIPSFLLLSASQLSYVVWVAWTRVSYDG